MFKFHEGRYAIAGDIKFLFHQIQFREEEQQARHRCRSSTAQLNSFLKTIKRKNTNHRSDYTYEDDDVDSINGQRPGNEVAHQVSRNS